MKFFRSLTLSIAIISTALLAQAQSGAGTANLIFTTIDVPGAAYTTISSINTAGDMTGDYGLTSTAQPQGFVYQGGAFTLFQYPKSYVTFGEGINDSGEVVGWSINAAYTTAVSFIYAGGKFTGIIRAPGDSATFAQGINNAGIITGGDGVLAGTKGFVLLGKAYTTIEPSGVYTYVYATGMNSSGEIVGDTLGPSSGFSYKNGQFRTISIPGQVFIYVLGINDSGVIVGYYSHCSPTVCTLSGFATMNGKNLTINYPGASSTALHGINKSGQLVGTYTIDNQIWHGFITSPVAARDFIGTN